MKNYNVTPIFYIPGTGGHFLSALLNCALINNKEPMKFNEWGHMHDSGFGFNNQIKPFNVDSIKNRYKDKLVFISTHNPDIDFLLTHFNKMIVISYDKLDFLEIASALTMKTFYTKNREVERIVKETNYNTVMMQIYMKQVVKTDNDNILYVSWANLYKEDPTILIDSLTKFTGTLKENFNVDTINEWRKLTSKGIMELKNICRNYSFI